MGITSRDSAPGLVSHSRLVLKVVVLLPVAVYMCRYK